MMVRNVFKIGGTLIMKITIKDVTAIIENANEAASNANKAVEQYKSENPGVDVEALLSEHKRLAPIFEQISSRELDKFVEYAKEQGAKMSFDSMEMGIVAAGRKDMQNGLAEILNTMDTVNPTCPECDEEMKNCGRSKKKL